MFSKASLQQLKDRIDLVELIGSYLPLKRTGHVYKTCCPFHEEKSPSFQVQAGAQHYHCFGCGAHGDVFSFAMRQAGLSFVESAKWLADRYHIVLEERKNDEEDRQRERSFEIMQKAQAFFVWCFWHHPQAKSAREYLFQRGIDEAFCHTFGVGYNPGQEEESGSKYELRDYLRSLRIRDEEMEKLGLITAMPSRRDFFAHRITFPILDYRSRVIAFSARKYLESTFGGKYINSPETILFKKSKTLFGLPYSRARIMKERAAILVEGQIDTLRMVQSGFNFVTAALGTAFGEDHVEQLKKLEVQRVWLLFDADAAGNEAAAKVGHLLMRASIDVKVARLDEGEDPDSVLSQSEGLAKMASKLEQAISFVDFLVQHRSKDRDLRSPATKNGLIVSLKEQIEAWQHPILVYEGLRSLARALCLPEDMIMGSHRAPHRIAGARALSHKPQATSGNSLDAKQTAVQNAWAKNHGVLEADLLRWMLAMGASCNGLVEYCLEHVQASDFTNQALGELWMKLTSRHLEKQPPLDFSSALLELDANFSPTIQELGSKRLDHKKMAIQLQQTVQELVHRRIMLQAEQLRLEIQSAQLSDEKAFEKAQEYAKLRREVPQVPAFVATLSAMQA